MYEEILNLPRVVLKTVNLSDSIKPLLGGGWSYFKFHIGVTKECVPGNQTHGNNKNVALGGLAELIEASRHVLKIWVQFFLR
jgi:hypothetical protein